jgi:hypothetical protein
MHIFWAVAKREILVELPRVPSGAQHGRGFSIVRSVREGNIAQFLLKVSLAKSTSSGSL